MFIDIVGNKYNRLLVKKYLGKSKWLCQCDCGNEKQVSTSALKQNLTKSCGCLSREVKSKLCKKNKYGTKHNLSKTRIYKIHNGMITRCYYSSASRYNRYGGRGIKVCDEWLGENGIVNFYNWSINNGYQDDLTIERIDIDKDYSPNNCKWIPKSEQSLNTSRNHYVTYNGETKCVEHWCKKLGLKSNTIYCRVKKNNISFYEAIFEYKKYTKNDKEFCKNGHKYTLENTGYTTQGYRYCKICASKSRKKCKDKKKVLNCLKELM